MTMTNLYIHVLFGSQLVQLFTQKFVRATNRHFEHFDHILTGSVSVMTLIVKAH